MDIYELMESVNIAEHLDEDTLGKIGNYVLEGYKTDKESRSGWDDHIEQWLELALQMPETKTWPWDGAANVKYPLLTTAAMQFSSRAYPALVPGVNAVRGRVLGMDEDGLKTNRAIRVGKHMNYQLFEEMNDWEEEMDRLLFALPIVGTMFKKTYYSEVKGRNISEIVYPDSLVVNYWAKNLEEADRITHVLELSSNDIHSRVARGIYMDVDLDNTTTSSENNTSVSQRVNGIQEQSVNDDSVPYTILEQHCWWDLDEDGYKEPYIVTIDEGTGNVLRIVTRFEEENIQWLGDTIVEIVPDHYFTKFSFVPSPDGGFYDIGFGVLLGPINDVINTTVNQLLDAGTLSNMQAGFIARGIKMKGGIKSFQPGEWKQVSSTGDDLRKGIVPLPNQGPSAVLFNLLNLMIESGQQLSSVTDMLMGDIPGQNTKATVAMAAIEQGMKVFSSIYKRCHRSLTKEYKKIFKLNGRHLDEEVYFTILDVGQEQGSSIGRRDYEIKDLDVVPASDPNVATEEQRLMKVQALFEVMQLGTINPQEVTKRYLEATEQPNIEKLMQLPPPQPSLEQMEFQLKQKVELERLRIEKEAQQTKSLLEIAKAEQAEMGQQLDLYKAQLEKLKARIDIAKGAKDESSSGSERTEG